MQFHSTSAAAAAVKTALICKSERERDKARHLMTYKHRLTYRKEAAKKKKYENKAHIRL